MTFQENEIHLRDYWRILSKRRDIALTVFFVIVVVACVYMFAATPLYKGSTQLLFDLENNQTMNFTEGGAAVIQMKDPTEYLNTQKEIVKSRSFGDRVVRKIQLQKTPYFLKLKEKNNSGLIPVVKKYIMNIFPAKANPDITFTNSLIHPEIDPELTDIILDNVELETGRMNTVMKINYLADDPAVAAAMANGCAAAFIEHNLDIRVKPFRD